MRGAERQIHRKPSGIPCSGPCAQNFTLSPHNLIFVRGSRNGDSGGRHSSDLRPQQFKSKAPPESGDADTPHSNCVQMKPSET
jgi:hypothetical protein